MHITRRQLRRIMQEELSRKLNEDKEALQLRRAMKANEKVQGACEEVFAAIDSGDDRAFDRAIKKCSPEGRLAKRARALFDKAMGIS